MSAPSGLQIYAQVPPLPFSSLIIVSYTTFGDWGHTARLVAAPVSFLQRATRSDDPRHPLPNTNLALNRAVTESFAA
jgi:hypothetical protein